MESKVNNQCLVIAYPHTGVVRHGFMDSVIKFINFDRTHGNILGALTQQQGMYIAGQRNKLVKNFLSTPDHLQWLLCIDSDQIFDPEVPYLLIRSAEEANARVMSALYFGVLAGEPSPMWWQKTADGEWATVSTVEAGIQEIAGFGMGMALIHRSVFEEMAPLRPDDPWKWFGHDLTMFNGSMERFGEDLCFCNRVSELGIKMYGDSRIAIGHDKLMNLDFDLFMKIANHRKDDDAPVRRVLEGVC